MEKMNKEAFKALCQEALPLIKELQEVAKRHEIKENMRLYLSSEGGFHLEGGFNGWDFSNYGGEPTIRYEYREEMS